jgi:hypothetical protein
MSGHAPEAGRRAGSNRRVELRQTTPPQPRGLTADKLLVHLRLPLAWHEQRIATSR